MVDIGNNTAHCIVALIWCACVISVAATGFYFTSQANAIGSETVFFVIIGEIGVSAMSSWYVGKVGITTSGVEVDTTANGQADAATIAAEVAKILNKPVQS